MKLWKAECSFYIVIFHIFYIDFRITKVSRNFNERILEIVFQPVYDEVSKSISYEYLITTSKTGLNLLQTYFYSYLLFFERGNIKRHQLELCWFQRKGLCCTNEHGYNFLRIILLFDIKKMNQTWCRNRIHGPQISIRRSFYIERLSYSILFINNYRDQKTYVISPIIWFQRQTFIEVQENFNRENKIFYYLICK